jgi:hypothetical protein
MDFSRNFLVATSAIPILMAIKLGRDLDRLKSIYDMLQLLPSRGSNGARDRVIKILVSQKRL